MTTQQASLVEPRTLLVEELRRLRTDFESQASQYHALKLFIQFITEDDLTSETLFPQPNHVIMLWQYLGDAIQLKNEGFSVTEFGRTGAELSAFAVIAGSSLDLFLRMITRAATLIPDKANQLLAVGRIEQVKLALGTADFRVPDKPAFSINSNPVAVWLNWMLTVIASVQPERFRNGHLTVDPYVGSLAAIDYLLVSLSPPHPAEQEEEDIVEVKIGVGGISVDVRALIRKVRRWWLSRFKQSGER